jgi:hypothetical protein
MDTLATELIKELKLNAKRWFIIALVELFIILGITGFIFWYINQPIEEVVTYEQEADTEGDYAPINQEIGG